MSDDYQYGYADGYRDALAQLLSPAQVAAELGTTQTRLREYSRQIDAGIMIGPTRVYTPADVERLKVRKATDYRLYKKDVQPT